MAVNARISARPQDNTKNGKPMTKACTKTLSTSSRLFVFLLLLGVSSYSWSAINIQHWKTGNGARVYFVAAPELPIVDLQVVFDGGGARDGDKPGVALLTNALLSEGAAGMSAEEISEGFDRLGANFGASSERDMAMLSLRSLSDKKVLDPALELFSDVLGKPDFPKDAFERERDRMLIGIKQRQQSPGDLADEAFYKAVFNGHPYAQLPDGYEDSVNAISNKDLSAFYQRYYVSNNAVIAIVGDLKREQAEAVAEKVVSRLNTGKIAEPLPEVAELTDGDHITIEYPSAQTHIQVGQPGMHRGQEDYFALYVGNHILGGSGLVARLSQEIREERGLAYSSYSYFLPMRKRGPFIIGLQTKNEQANEALKVLKETLAEFTQKGPTAEELEAAKKNITGGFALRISSNKKIIGYVSMIGFYGLPLNYLDEFNAKINKLTVADIRNAFQKRVKLDKMVTVLVGSSETAKEGDKKPHMHR